jgi:hypothetical protein
LGVTMSELLPELEVSTAPKELKHAPEARDHRAVRNARQSFEIQKLLRRLRLQNAAMDRTMTLLEELSIAPPARPVSPSMTRVRKGRPRGK